MNMNSNKSSLVNPDPALQFLFAMFGILTWLSVITKMPEDSQLTMGILELALGIGAFAGSILNLVRGDPHGNINLVLSVILGFSGGVTQIVSVMAAENHITFHPWISSVILLLGAVYMACFLPMLTDKPLYAFISHLSVVLGFLFSSLSMLLSIPVFKQIGAWCLFVFALTALYGGVSDMYACMNIHIWQGKSLRQKFCHK